MDPIELFTKLLRIEPPWQVMSVVLEEDVGPKGSVVVHIEASNSNRLVCRQCRRKSPQYDTRHRQWRHLDTMQYQTLITADIPRVQCAEHGVAQVQIPWAEDHSRMTALFEAYAIDWLGQASVSAVAQQLDLSWDQVAGIQERAVKRGLARRSLKVPASIGVDETSFKKRHDYVTIINDLQGNVLHVAEGRDTQALSGFYDSLTEQQRECVEEVAMDMWPAYIRATEDALPDAQIVFDKFHIAKHLGDAVDRVRRSEHRELLSRGDERLKKTKYQWLVNPHNMSRQSWLDFSVLRTSQLKVARAWAIKELAMGLWGYRRRGWAERGWQRWYQWAIRSRLEPIKKVARMIKKHWDGVIAAATTSTTNAHAESINSRIQRVKRMANGFRNRERFKNAIYFHLGGLDMYPKTALIHTNP